jgi:hypothetical protein
VLQRLRRLGLHNLVDGILHVGLDVVGIEIRLMFLQIHGVYL